LVIAKARPRAGCTDNCQRVVKAILRVVFALNGSDGMYLLQLSCGLHTSNLIIPDLRKLNAIVDAYVIWLKALMSCLHTAAVKRQLSGELREKMPWIQDAKWNSFIRASRWAHQH
jgi:hypothetical protein